MFLKSAVTFYVIIFFVTKIDIKSELRFSLCKEAMHHVLKKISVINYKCIFNTCNIEIFMQ